VFFAHFATFAVGVKTATAKYAKIAKKSLEDPHHARPCRRCVLHGLELMAHHPRQAILASLPTRELPPATQRIA